MSVYYECANCESHVEYGSKYCSNCGAELEWSKQPTEKDNSSEGYPLDLERNNVVFAYGLAHGKWLASGTTRNVVKAAGRALGVTGFGLLGGALFSTATNDLLQYSAESMGFKELNLCHSKTRLYGLTPDEKQDVIDANINDVDADCKNRLYTTSDLYIHIVQKDGSIKHYTFRDVYKPSLFIESINSAKQGKFDKTIYTFEPSEENLLEQSNSADEGYDDTEDL